MKKLTLLLLGSTLAIGAQAQQLRQHSVVALTKEGKSVDQKVPNVNSGAKIQASRQHLSKGTGVAFYTETFASGQTNTNHLATGWTASTPTTGFSGTWHWTNQAATGSYNIGTLSSTTKADGWMIYDSDSIGSTNPTTPFFEGFLTSPTVNCSTHPNVEVSFQQYFHKFADTCYLEVSNNGGTSWTRFPIFPNNSMSNNGYSANPELTRIIVSSVAGGQANVKFRFHYLENYAAGGGAYNWLVDDFKVSDADQVDVAIGKSGMLSDLGNNTTTTYVQLESFAPFSSIPLQLVDSLLPLTTLTNYGYTAQSTTPVTVTVYNGTTQVYTQPLTYTSALSVNGIDSFVEFTGARFKPTAVGSYTAVFSVTAAGDANAANNTDTVRFNVTDSVYAPYWNQGFLSGIYIHRPAASGGERSWNQGVHFEIGNGHTDTLTSVSASFYPSTTVGTQVQVHLYKVTGTGTALNFLSVAKSKIKTLTAADINATGSSSVFTTFQMTALNSGVLRLQPNDYAAVITTVNAAPSALVAIWTTGQVYPYPGISGYGGQSDTSNNSSNYSFAQNGGVATGQTDVPLMRLNFANNAKQSLTVGNISGVTVGSAFPNPANTSINVPVTVTDQANVSVSLTNLVGQVIRTQDLGIVSGGNTKIASIATSDLANGVYMCTIEAKGQRIATRIVVAH